MLRGQGKKGKTIYIYFVAVSLLIVPGTFFKKSEIIGKYDFFKKPDFYVSAYQLGPDASADSLWDTAPGFVKTILDKLSSDTQPAEALKVPRDIELPEFLIPRGISVGDLKDILYAVLILGGKLLWVIALTIIEMAKALLLKG